MPFNPRDLLFIAGFFMMLASSFANARPLPSENVLHRKALSDGKELVVIQQPAVPISTVMEFLPVELPDHVVGLSCVSLELRSATASPIRLWSQMHPCLKGSACNEYRVLDVLVLPNRILFATVDLGNPIWLHEVNLISPNRVTRVEGPDWNMLATAIPFTPERVTAKFNYDEKQNRVEILVTDSVNDKKWHSLFEQNRDEWRFTRIKQW